MKIFKYLKTIFVLFACAIVFTTSGVCVNKVTAEPVAQVKPATEISVVKPSVIVNSPKSYLNKTVKMNVKFDKFSTLGLDYKPAFRSSDKYISFLIKRDDTNYDIPLSEMKLFLKREQAEKFIELKTNDEISVKGIVFSDALGDAWIDVQELTITKKAPEKDGVK